MASGGMRDSGVRGLPPYGAILLLELSAKADGALPFPFILPHHFGLVQLYRLSAMPSLAHQRSFAPSLAC